MGKSMHVLLVEDSPTLQKVLSDYITQADHKVTVAKDGETAVQIMEMKGADLIICDVEMPGLNGYETVSIIREALGEYWVPILFLTKHNTVEYFLRGIEVGADDYIIKPINQKVLLAKLKIMERFIIMQKQLNEALSAHEKSLKIDGLTQVYSKEHFLELAKLQWSILIRQKQPTSILVIEIDYFKEFTEHYESSAANKCIQKVAHRLSASIHRPGDFVGRINEDQFVIMLPETSKSGSEKIAERILTQIESLNIENKKSRVLGVVSVSIGGQAIIDLKHNSFADAFQVAHKNLERVQHNNGNDYIISKNSKLEFQRATEKFI
jgi:diguanylate cyclase (GGDEF)-like protein